MENVAAFDTSDRTIWLDLSGLSGDQGNRESLERRGCRKYRPIRRVKPCLRGMQKTGWGEGRRVVRE